MPGAVTIGIIVKLSFERIKPEFYLLAKRALKYITKNLLHHDVKTS